ncbi:hypothetical protein ACEQPO_08615 [Bacillus sp. SL00103]
MTFEQRRIKELEVLIKSYMLSYQSKRLNLNRPSAPYIESSTRMQKQIDEKDQQAEGYKNVLKSISFLEKTASKKSRLRRQRYTMSRKNLIN